MNIMLFDGRVVLTSCCPSHRTTVSLLWTWLWSTQNPFNWFKHNFDMIANYINSSDMRCDAIRVWSTHFTDGKENNTIFTLSFYSNLATLYIDSTPLFDLKLTWKLYYTVDTTNSKLHYIRRNRLPTMTKGNHGTMAWLPASTLLHSILQQSHTIRK